MRAFRPASTVSAAARHRRIKVGEPVWMTGVPFRKHADPSAMPTTMSLASFSRTAGDGPRNATEYGHMSRVNVDNELAISSLALDLLFD